MWLSNVLSYFVTASGVHATPENRRELESGARAYTYLAGLDRDSDSATGSAPRESVVQGVALRHSLTKQPDELGVTWLRLAHEAMPNEKVNRDERRVWLPHRQILPQRAQDLGDGQEAELLHLAVGA